MGKTINPPSSDYTSALPVVEGEKEMNENSEGVRGLETMTKKKNEGAFIIINIGPSTEKTNEELFNAYVALNTYRNGKDFYELLDEANNPNLSLKPRRA